MQFDAMIDGLESSGSLSPEFIQKLDNKIGQMMSDKEVREILDPVYDRERLGG
jgi:hypothetical protein